MSLCLGRILGCNALCTSLDWLPPHSCYAVLRLVCPVLPIVLCDALPCAVLPCAVLPCPVLFPQALWMMSSRS
jgi:hypothetical protein